MNQHIVWQGSREPFYCLSRQEIPKSLLKTCVTQTSRIADLAASILSLNQSP